MTDQSGWIIGQEDPSIHDTGDIPFFTWAINMLGPIIMMMGVSRAYIKASEIKKPQVIGKI